MSSKYAINYLSTTTAAYGTKAPLLEKNIQYSDKKKERRRLLSSLYDRNSGCNWIEVESGNTERNDNLTKYCVKVRLDLSDPLVKQKYDSISQEYGKTTGEFGWKCVACGKVAQQKSEITQHIKSVSYQLLFRFDYNLS